MCISDLTGAANGFVGEPGDEISSVRPCNGGGDAQKLSLPQLFEVDAVDAVLGVARVRGVLGVAGANGPAGRERTDVIEQSLDVDVLAADALGGVERTLSSGTGIVRSDIDVRDRFANSLPSSPKLTFRLSSPRKRYYDSLSSLNVYMFLSLRCLTISLGTAYLFTPIVDPRPAEISNGSSDSTSGSSTSSFST